MKDTVRSATKPLRMVEGLYLEEKNFICEEAGLDHPSLPQQRACVGMKGRERELRRGEGKENIERGITRVSRGPLHE